MKRRRELASATDADPDEEARSLTRRLLRALLSRGAARGERVRRGGDHRGRHRGGPPNAAGWTVRGPRARSSGTLRRRGGGSPRRAVLPATRRDNLGLLPLAEENGGARGGGGGGIVGDEAHALFLRVFARRRRRGQKLRGGGRKRRRRNRETAFRRGRLADAGRDVAAPGGARERRDSVADVDGARLGGPKPRPGRVGGIAAGDRESSTRLAALQRTAFHLAIVYARAAPLEASLSAALDVSRAARFPTRAPSVSSRDGNARPRARRRGEAAPLPDVARARRGAAGPAPTRRASVKRRAPSRAAPRRPEARADLSPSGARRRVARGGDAAGEPQTRLRAGWLICASASPSSRVRRRRGRPGPPPHGGRAARRRGGRGGRRGGGVLARAAGRARAGGASRRRAGGAVRARARAARSGRAARERGGADAGPAVAYPAPRAFRRHRVVGSTALHDADASARPSRTRTSGSWTSPRTAPGGVSV